jgi:Fic family protein
MFYLSAYFDEHRDEYVARLRALGGSDQAWNAWIEFFLTAVETQALRNADKARDIKALYDRLKAQVIELTRSLFAVPLLDALFETPVFPSTHVQLPGRTRPSRQAIAQLLRVLREANILKVVREGSGRRAQVLALAELINLAEGKPVI